MYRKERHYNSDVHIYEFDPSVERIEPTFGVRGKLEPLSKLGEPREDEEIACKINAQFFELDGSVEFYGLFYKNGVTYQPGSYTFPTITFTTDNKLVWGYGKENVWGIGVSYSLVLDGKKELKNTAPFPHYINDEPRTMIGQKANGNILLVVVEGRNTNDSGMTANEQAETMLKLGAVWAVNLDGGGSSEMIVDGKIVNYLPYGERAIGTGLIVYRKKEAKKLKVYISPSTQENNIGIGNYGTEEMRMNQLADIVCPLLEYNGFEVRRNRPEMTLSQVIADSDAWKPDIHVAIHSNAANGKTRGCEVWGYLITGKVTNSQRLSEAIYKELSAITPTADRGVKNGVPQRYAEIVTVKATSCIVEIGFHDNLEDALWIMNNMPAIADAIVKGVCNYFGVTFRKPVDAVDWQYKYNSLVNDIKALIAKYSV